MSTPLHGLSQMRRRPAALALTLTALLTACSSSTPSDPTSKYSYEPGRDYSWSDRLDQEPYPGGKTFPWVGLPLSAQSGPQETYLSDLTYTSATSGYGPLELDRSNNDLKGGDGQTLTIGGVTYTKGLGAHAASDIRYSLRGACTVFTAQVGVDDEVGDRGSVVFQVWSGATKLYDSGLMTGRDAAKAVSVDVSGVQELRLVVTNGGDNIDYDHADWANARVTCSAATVSGEQFLSDVTPGAPTNGYGPIEKDTSNGEQLQGDGRAMSIGGTSFQKGLGVHANSSLSYALGGKCTTFTAQVGVDDEVGDRGSVVFQVFGAAGKLYDSGVLTGRDVARAVSVNVSGEQTLRLVVTDASDNNYYDHADWANARITCTTPVGVTLPVAVNFQPAASAVPGGYVADTGAAYSDARGYGWVRQDSLTTTAHTPLDITLNSRDRALANVDPRLNTLLHMQYTATAGQPAERTPAAWEYALPNGVYTVTVAAGDASNALDSSHQLNVEGQPAVTAFQPDDTHHFRTATLRVNVADGRLTVDARGGTNTKINYVVVAPGDRPSVRVTNPQDAETMVSPSASITADVNLVNGGIDPATLTAQSVRLTETATGAQVPATLNTSGGGDVIVLKPGAPLKANSAYTFEVGEGVKDIRGNAFLPFRTGFTTGSQTTTGTAVAFEQVAQPNVPTNPYTAVEIGPDNRLYAATLAGEILRFNMAADGTLGTPQVIKSVQAANGGPRTIIGMRFDPASTADNLILWISNNYFWTGASEAPDWSGKITRLSGPDLATVQDYVVGLPRSTRDHQTNSIAFKPGEPTVMYVLQGSNSAMGAPDTGWGNRPERLLSAAVLRVDLSKIASAPVNVQTSDGGQYNPYAPGAPVTLYATGVRNAYDLVWHTNGQLYVPTNGSAAGGNTPGTPATLPDACARRTDGAYTGPSVPALNGVSVQHDFLFRITQGGYYGHPNPTRCEWVMNGGNPTAGADPAEVVVGSSGTGYPVGVLPDRNWRGFAYDFGEHASPNGVIEEYTLPGNSKLKNKLLVVRYSAGKDIIVLTPGGANQDIVQEQTLTNVPGLTDFKPSPLDLTENRANGHLYVAQLDEATGSGTITLVRPK